MTSSRVRTAKLICIGVGVAALLGGCSSPSSSSTVSETTTSRSKEGPTTSTKPLDPPSSAPATEACRALTFGDIGRYSNATTPTSCGRRHTAFTFAVATLPADVAFDGVEIRNNAVQRAAADACTSKFASYVGGDAATRALVRLTVTYFLPSQRDFDLGARWVRCDVIALQAERILSELPRKLQGVLDDESILTDYGLCSAAQPGAADSVMVMCNQPHAYRAIAALRLGETDDDGYPGEQVTRVEGQQRCMDLTRDRLGPKGGYTLVWTYPTAADWTAGQRFGYCWNETPR